MWYSADGQQQQPEVAQPMATQPVVAQPMATQPVTSQPVVSDIQVRPMVPADAEFVGRVSVEAFESKFAHCVGKENIEKAIRGTQEGMALMGHESWRMLVATCNGEPAGVINMDYKGCKEPDAVGEASVRYLGCWSICRLLCLDMKVKHKCKPTEGYIQMICCDSKFRGKGVGKRLMEAGEAQARDRGCTVLSLWVASDNRARNLYERQGFVVKDTQGGCCASCTTGINEFQFMEKPL